jgi:hypothetical protein
VARNLGQPLKFYRRQLTTEPGYTWYLDRVAAAVERARQSTGAYQVRVEWGCLRQHTPCPGAWQPPA